METIAIIVTICVFVGGILWYVITEPKRKAKEQEQLKAQRAEKERIDREYRTPRSGMQNGKLLMTFYSNVKEGMGKAVCLFLDKSGIVVFDYASGKWARKIQFSALEMDNDTYSFHPAKLVYTGATVGGFHTGGFHTEEAYCTQGHRKSGNGVICCAVDGKERPILFIKVHEPAFQKALYSYTRKSDDNETLKQYFGKGEYVIPLLDLSSKAKETSKFFLEAALAQNNSYGAAAAMSRASTSRFRSMKVCESLAKSLNELMDKIEEYGAEKVIDAYNKE